MLYPAKDGGLIINQQTIGGVNGLTNENGCWQKYL